MVIENFKCPLKNIKSVKEWIREPETENYCPPCLIAPLADYYLGNLQKAGETELARELKEVFDSGDVDKLAETMDSIKERVSDELRDSLLQFDCFAQTLKEG